MCAVAICQEQSQSRSSRMKPHQIGRKLALICFAFFFLFSTRYVFQGELGNASWHANLWVKSRWHRSLLRLLCRIDTYSSATLLHDTPHRLERGHCGGGQQLLCMSHAAFYWRLHYDLTPFIVWVFLWPDDATLSCRPSSSILAYTTTQSMSRHAQRLIVRQGNGETRAHLQLIAYGRLVSNTATTSALCNRSCHWQPFVSDCLAKIEENNSNSCCFCCCCRCRQPSSLMAISDKNIYFIFVCLLIRQRGTRDRNVYNALQ